MSIPYVHTLLLCCMLIVFGSCSTSTSKQNFKFEKSTIYSSVKCTQDTNISYALYLPSDYETGKACPVLILFDPHGKGVLPVKLFSEEASKHGFIIAGSNNSKNGMSFDQTKAIYHSILNDLNARFNPEPKAIYVGGFSGGSRVAGALAITEGNIVGVIGCGAGLPNLNKQPTGKFSYLAVAGKQDFNLAEMQQLELFFDQAGFINHLLVFEGNHQWPPKELIPDIFTWLKFDVMRQRAVPEIKSEINSFIEKNDSIANDYASRKKYIKQRETYIMMMHFLQGLTDVTPLQSEIDRLTKEKIVIMDLEKQKQLLSMEQKLQSEFAPKIENRDIDWWRTETNKLHKLYTQPADNELNNVYKRLLGYLSLNCYMYSTNALKQGDLLSASKFITIYSMVDPSNAEAPYLAAKVASLNGNPEVMFESLHKAIELGFDDFHRLESDIEFRKYRQDKRFRQMLAPN